MKSTNALLVYITDISEEHIKSTSIGGRFPWHQLLLCTKGGGYYICDHRRERKIEKNDVLFLEGASKYGIRTDTGISFKKIAFGGRHIPKIMEYASKTSRIINDRTGDMWIYFNNIFEEYNRSASPLTLSLQMYQLFMEFAERLSRIETEADTLPRLFIAPIVSIMEAHYFDASWQVEKICPRLNTSKEEIDKTFAAAYGMDSMEYMRHIRLEKSKCTLFLHQIPDDVWHYCGFSSNKEFFNAFEHTYGETPDDFLNKYFPPSGK